MTLSVLPATYTRLPKNLPRPSQEPLSRHSICNWFVYLHWIITVETFVKKASANEAGTLVFIIIYIILFYLKKNSYLIAAYKLLFF
jgi:hypothetical protein